MDGPFLARKLNLLDAVVIGLGSMIGAGIFAAFGPAARAAGSGLLIGLAIAAVIAYCNATSSAQLAAQYPTSGGSYVYGRERLGPWWGFFAGWSFLVGKTASCAAMALTFAAYAAPAAWGRPVAVAAVAALAVANCFGVTRTARLARAIVAFVLLVLALVVVAGVAGDTARHDVLDEELLAAGWYGIVQSAGLLFFAFAGYARIATLGEEVKDPVRVIGRAIVIALVLVLVMYALIALTVLTVLGGERVASSPAPLTEVVIASSWGWAEPVVRLGAAAATLGALLALVAGIGRTSLAMARNRDLPAWLAVVHPTYRVPQHAQLAVAALVSVLVLGIDLRGAIGFSSFGVLLYYLVANVAAFTQEARHRRYPRWLQVLGAGGCCVLVATLPPGAVVTGIAVLAVGVIYRVLSHVSMPRGPGTPR